MPDETDGELDGAYESLCSIDTDWAGNSGITEVDLIALSNRVTEIGAQLMVTIDAKHCGALGGSVVYVTDHAFVQSARAQIASWILRGHDTSPMTSERLPHTHLCSNDIARERVRQFIDDCDASGTNPDSVLR